MHMHWILRFKDTRQAKTRLVIIGYHDPRIGRDVSTGGQKKKFSIAKRGVKNGGHAHNANG